MRIFAALLATSLLAAPAARAADPLPWGQNTDELAWEIFVQIVSPSGAPGADKKVEFETWASDQDIFQDNPAKWPSVDQPKALSASVLARAVPHGLAPQALPAGAGLECPPPGLSDVAKGDTFPTSGCIGEEVRRNWATFQYIVGNGLDTKAGRAAFAKADKKVDMPSDAIEFKGDWARVEDVEKWLNLSEKEVHDDYYTSQATIGGKSTEYALLAFHFSSKLTKNWIWADFEHERNPGRCDTIGCRDDWGAKTKDVKPNAKPWQSYGDCAHTKDLDKLSEAAGISGVWKHYCMKGTQIDFVAHDGTKLLGNSVIEPLAADVAISASSCITCHAGALFEKATGDPYTGILNQSPVGPEVAYDKSKYASYDLVWGLLTGGK